MMATVTMIHRDDPSSIPAPADRPMADVLLQRAQVCRKAALRHRERGEYQTAAWLEGKAWGFHEAAGHLLLRGSGALRSTR